MTQRAAVRPLIAMQDVAKRYRPEPGAPAALCEVSLDIVEGEFVAIVGPSGSGKSTLLNLVAGLDRPTSGKVLVQGLEVSALGEEALCRWRSCAIGIVFQFFQLLPTLTAAENVMLAMELAGCHRRERREQAQKRLEAVGLGGMGDRLPSELSGGEQQRVAIARALANDPPILLADEPTGNLDSRTGERIIALLASLHGQGKTVVLVTHEEALAARATRRIEMRDGRVIS